VYIEKPAKRQTLKRFDVSVKTSIEQYENPHFLGCGESPRKRTPAVWEVPPDPSVGVARWQWGPVAGEEGVGNEGGLVAVLRPSRRGGGVQRGRWERRRRGRHRRSPGSGTPGWHPPCATEGRWRSTRNPPPPSLTGLVTTAGRPSVSGDPNRGRRRSPTPSKTMVPVGGGIDGVAVGNRGTDKRQRLPVSQERWRDLGVYRIRSEGATG